MLSPTHTAILEQNNVFLISVWIWFFFLFVSCYKYEGIYALGLMEKPKLAVDN